MSTLLANPAPAAPATAPDAPPRERWLRGRPARLTVAIALSLEIGLVIGFATVYRPFDLQIYLWGGRAVSQGLRLYLVRSHGNWFTYPPFAAALFAPLAAIPSVVARLGWELASVGAFAWCCVITLKLTGYRASRTAVLAVLAAGLLLDGYLLFALAPMWWTPHSRQTGDYGAHGLITVIANSFLIAGVGFVIYQTVRAYRSRADEPRLESSRASRRGGLDQPSGRELMTEGLTPTRLVPGRPGAGEREDLVCGRR